MTRLKLSTLLFFCSTIPAFASSGGSQDGIGALLVYAGRKLLQSLGLI